MNKESPDTIFRTIINRCEYDEEFFDDFYNKLFDINIKTIYDIDEVRLYIFRKRIGIFDGKVQTYIQIVESIKDMGNIHFETNLMLEKTAEVRKIYERVLRKIKLTYFHEYRNYRIKRLIDENPECLKVSINDLKIDYRLFNKLRNKNMLTIYDILSMNEEELYCTYKFIKQEVKDFRRAIHIYLEQINQKKVKHI